MKALSFLTEKLSILWSFFQSPKLALEDALKNDPWSTIGLCAFIIFLETGIIIFPWLPGDGLLILLGLALQRNSTLSVHQAVLWLGLAAFVGAGFNYFVGRAVGGSLLPHLQKYEFFNTGFKKGEEFYKKHGGKAVMLSRSVGWARTFVPFLSGIYQMKIVPYTLYNFFGAFAWVSVFVYLGYKLPESWSEWVGHIVQAGFLLPIIVYVVMSNWVRIKNFYALLRSKLKLK